MFLHLCVILFTGGRVGFPACITGHIPFPAWITSHMTGWLSDSRGSASGGLCIWGVCIPSFTWACLQGGWADPPSPTIHGILRDTINKRAVHILLECIPVLKNRLTSKENWKHITGSNNFTQFNHRKRWIALIDLDNPSENVKKVQRQSKWEISVVQWNPHNSHKNVFVSAVSTIYIQQVYILRTEWSIIQAGYRQNKLKVKYCYSFSM